MFQLGTQRIGSRGTADCVNRGCYSGGFSSSLGAGQNVVRNQEGASGNGSLQSFDAIFRGVKDSNVFKLLLTALAQRIDGLHLRILDNTAFKRQENQLVSNTCYMHWIEIAV